jgi:hypothetical protein
VATETKRRGEGRQARQSGTRRLVAGLRISHQDERLLEVVRPFLPEATSEGELAYRLWRRGLELTLAEAAGLGVELPPGVGEEQIAALAAQRLLLCVPLLRCTGKLSLLGIDAERTESEPQAIDTTSSASGDIDLVDQGAADAIAGMGASDFL